MSFILSIPPSFPASGFKSTYLSVRMKTMLLSVIFVLFASTLAQDDCLPNPNSPSCDDRDPANSTICQLTCDRVSTTCTQYDEAKCSQIGVDVTEESFTDMFATRCKEICEQSRDAEAPAKVCRFYKVSVST